MKRLSVSIDATPLLGNRTGIGTYVAHLLDGLADDSSLHIRAAAFSVRQRSGLGDLPVGVRPVRRPVPARLLNKLWLRGDFPHAELVMGRASVVHGTNYVLPPPRRAAAVVNVHDLSFLRYPELVNAASLAYRELVPRAVAHADAVLALTQAAADEIAEAYGVDEAKLHVAHLGIDPAWFDAPARPPSAPNSYFLAVGTVEPRKGLDVLLRAYRSLLDAGEDVPPLVLAGQSGWGPALVRSQIPSDRLIETGFVDQQALIGWVAHATALIFPSRYEGFGLPPLEALAAGTAVVASDLPALREVLGSHASFVPTDDADALAAAVLQTLTTPPDEDAREAGRAHARTFTWSATAAKTASVYHQIAAG